MRKPKGKLVALLAGAVVVVLVAVGATFWKDVYCHVFLDPRLVGRWERTDPIEPSVFLEFDKVGNAWGNRTASPSWTPETSSWGCLTP